MLLVLADGGLGTLATASAGTSALVALLALILAIFAFRAAGLTANRNLRLVGFAFLVFAVKNVFSAYNVFAHESAGMPSVPHDALELVLSLFDLGLILLLFLPLLWRRRS